MASKETLETFRKVRAQMRARQPQLRPHKEDDFSSYVDFLSSSTGVDILGDGVNETIRSDFVKRHVILNP